MTEWGLDPVYISENWTDEMLQVMVEKLIERKKKINEAIGKTTRPSNTVSDTEFFRRAGKKIKVIHGN